MRYLSQVLAIFLMIVDGIICSEPMKRNYVQSEAIQSLATTPRPYQIWNWGLMASHGPPVSTIQRREDDEKYDKERQLDTLGGTYIYDYRTPREYEEFYTDGEDVLNGMKDTSESSENEAEEKRSFDTLGNMQLHGYKRGFDTLGGVNLHGGYKRFISSLGGTNIHGYKRALDSLGGALVHPYKRYFSSLGGGNIHGGYKRSVDKRYLSSLGGGNIYKRRFDNLGGVNLHSGYKRFLSSLGGSNIHNGGSKRTLSSLGGVNLHGYNGYKRTLSSLGGANVYGYKRDDSDIDNDFAKRELDSLGGFGIHRFKRSESKEEGKEIKENDEKQ